MGICFSKKKDSSKKNPFHFTAKPPLPGSEETQSKSPPPMEEETVKEVLSETQKPPTFPKFQEDKKKEKMEDSTACSINGCDEIPETSDICSCTESFSVSTIAEKKPEEEEGEVEMQLKEVKFHQKRSLSGDFSYSSEKSQNSPARRSSPSPGRKTLVRDLGVMNPAWIPSSSRLQSPAMRNDLGRGYSERKADRSLSQIPAELPEEDGRKMEKRKDLSMTESLENPMVSLECFIFL